MHPIGIERLGTFGMPPVEMVALAADLGAECIGIGLAPSSAYNPDRHRGWSLRDDPAERRATIAACRERGIFVSIVEGFAVTADNDMRAFAGDLDLVRALGCDRINVVSIGQDMSRTIDGFAELAELASGLGIEVSAEMGSLGPLKRVDAAREVARGVGRANFSLVIDSMHFFRLGNAVADLAALEPALIGYVQLADAPWQDRFASYIEEAMFERMVPGQGELPLAAFVRALPPDVVVSVEVPLRSWAERGVSARERTAACIAGAKALLR